VRPCSGARLQQRIQDKSRIVAIIQFLLRKKSAMGRLRKLSRRRFLQATGALAVSSALDLNALAENTPPTQAEPGIMKTDPVLSGEQSPFVDAPASREKTFRAIRREAAAKSSELGPFSRPTNGDEERFPNYIGNFSKQLPHNELGEVDPDVYQQLLAGLRSGDFAQIEEIQLGGTGRLLNPLGGLTFNIQGPDSPFGGFEELLVEPPPAFDSPEFAAQAVELYWMAVLRDVPLKEFNEDNALVRAAVEDLQNFPGYQGPQPVTPQNLFRVDYEGVNEGPMVSQFLLHPFRYNGILVQPKTRVPVPVEGGTGIDFLTTFDEWLCAQRGFPSNDVEGGNPYLYPTCELGEARFVPDNDLRALYSLRALGQNAAQDNIYGAYFRAILVLNELGFSSFSPLTLDPGNPYRQARNQIGFASLGFCELAELIGLATQGERHTWYQKWNMHRWLRPEAMGGRVHNVRTGRANYPLHPQLINSPVLEHIFRYNHQVNQRRFGRDGTGSYLLPILAPRGSPAHPSLPAGHAFSAGACVTLLKAWLDKDLEFPNPVQPSADGRTLEPYTGPPLTIQGELNKLAHNLSWGRDMSGVHWRADNLTGNKQGEAVAIRILEERLPCYPEPISGWTLTKFDGTTVKITA
jgi:hypothetical protein